MALVLIKEDGTGLADANAYANAADGDAYFDGHLYATAWTGATTANKEAALVFATRLIDAEYQFHGYSANATQALSWPRQRCPDPDTSNADLGTGNAEISSEEVPKEVLQATCEMARELLILDRTTAPPGEGLKYQNVGADQTGYSKTDVRPIISHIAQAMLAKFGTLIRSKIGSVALTRV